MKKVKLTKEQELLFKALPSPLRKETALQYIKGGYTCQTTAYLKACKKLKKKASKNPVTSASEILNYPNVVDFINSVKVVVAESIQVDAQYVLRRLKQIDELDVADILDGDGNMLQIRSWPKAWRVSISGLDITEMMTGDVQTIIKKIKWPDKLKNLELLGKHVEVKAWDKEALAVTTNNVMLVPTAGSVDDWEKQAQAQQGGALSG